jgi:hypothetical protein
MGDDLAVADAARTSHAMIRSKRQTKWTPGAAPLFVPPTTRGKQQHQEEGRYEIACSKVPYQFYVRWSTQEGDVSEVCSSGFAATAMLLMSLKRKTTTIAAVQRSVLRRSRRLRRIAAADVDAAAVVGADRTMTEPTRSPKQPLDLRMRRQTDPARSMPTEPQHQLQPRRLWVA